MTSLESGRLAYVVEHVDPSCGPLIEAGQIARCDTTAWLGHGEPLASPTPTPTTTLKGQPTP